LDDDDVELEKLDRITGAVLASGDIRPELVKHYAKKA
jgi:hypothetical protein